MKFTKAPIFGVVLIEPEVFGDARGFFMETWQEEKFKAAGIDARFVQDNHSRSSQWTLRGLHLQVQHTQGKLVRVTSGSVFDVTVDARSSPSFGRHGMWSYRGESSDAVGPPGLAHGIGHLQSADFLYKCTDFYSPEHERTLAWDDPGLNVRWPLPPGVQPKLSAKDARGASFDQIEKFA
jgi:dTDP-4-dehydrorhamnose 3,5-epimerase